MQELAVFMLDPKSGKTTCLYVTGTESARKLALEKDAEGFYVSIRRASNNEFIHHDGRVPQYQYIVCTHLTSSLRHAVKTSTNMGTSQDRARKLSKKLGVDTSVRAVLLGAGLAVGKQVYRGGYLLESDGSPFTGTHPRKAYPRGDR